ncbi:tetratricopeptide repeat protein [Spirosoma sp. KCTC 42546]|uniref:tetratricopeptide repeat protein n=1 Tax=Spirosoma sp. KCTC 42546 TaxID=2520506 RepID=UPI00115AC745|nr:tetratricopeptide repeat protein [Spirosoma sp. KCTC 42546]QDK82041.1 tetratricopeptide repeat protein [Spirosoma sp. KCTC 42546]
MPNVIMIQEDHFTDQRFSLRISFNNGSQYEVILPNPVDRDQERRFEWYFEQQLRNPFLDRERVKRVVEEIRQYGEALFTALFQTPNIAFEYRTCRNQGLDQLEFAIVGKSTGFHTIHWEALKDPELPEAFAAGRANVFRKNNQPVSFLAPISPSTVLNLLLVTARPDWEDDVNYRTIIRPVIELIESAQLRVDAHILRPGTYQSLVEHLDAKPAGFYHLVHFDTHGALLEYTHIQQGVSRSRYQMQANWGLSDLATYEGKKAFLLFEGAEKGQAVPVSAEDLAKLLKARNIPVCLLNACQSAKEEEGPYQTSLAAKLMEAGVQAVLGQSYSITVSAARVLMQHLYEALFDHANLNRAIASGRRELAMNKNRQAYFDQTIELEDWLLPVLYQNQPVSFTLQALTPDEEEQYYLRREAAYHPSAEPVYGFVGRDLDILSIEKHLLKHNMLLVRGMGGTGKTTLLEYLARWWERTGWVKKTFYFGYDKRAYTLEQILNELGRQLLNKWEFAQFQASSLVTQRSKIEDKLTTEAYCLILDNFESITGTSLAIPNTLSEADRTDLGDFLSRLRKKSGKSIKSFVIFGSRSDESWLASATFDKNVYKLTGLDQEARTDLARLILEPIGLLGIIAKDADFGKLMALLAGYPLAMEVILPNLARQTAGEIMANLRLGDKGIDPQEVILRCIEYSHSNLSADAQQLLVCLAPFSGYINLTLLENYFTELKQQPAYQQHSFEHWADIIGEAVKWGLLEPVSAGSPILSLQPVFPYFLQQKLQTGADAARKQELDIAFRNYYDGFAKAIYELLDSKQANERQMGIILVQMEYANIFNALQISLKNHVSIFYSFLCLSRYADSNNDQQSGLQIAQTILAQIESYPKEMLVGQIGYEFAGVMDKVGTRLLLIKRVAEAKEAYKKALLINNNLQGFSPETLKKYSAPLYHQLGRVAQEEREWSQAKEYYQKSLAILMEFNDRYGQASTYHQLGRVAQEEREWSQAKEYYQKSLAILMEFNDRYGQASTYHQLGRVAEEEREWSQAKEYYQKSLAIKMEFNDRYSQESTYHQLGMVAQEEREWSQAKEYYQKSLAILMEFNDRYGQARTYHQLGRVAQEEREWSQAKEYYQKSLAIKMEFNDRYGQASTYHQLGRVAQEEREWSQAKEYYQKSLAILMEFNDRYGQASTYHQLGRVAEEEREWSQAKEYYQKSLAILMEFNDRYGQASTYHQLGMVAQEEREWSQAKEYYQKSLAILMEFEDEHNQQIVLRSLARLQEDQEDQPQ